MNADCLFCRLVQGELPGQRVNEDDDFVVLLTIYPINPINPSHVMVVPKKHVDGFYDVADELYTPMMLLVKRMALAVKAVFNPVQVVMETSGVTNRHVHVHVLPVYGMYDRVPQEFQERQLAQPASHDDLAQVARRLAERLSSG